MLSDMQDKIGIAFNVTNPAAGTTNLKYMKAALHDPSVACTECMKKSYDIVRRDWSGFPSIVRKLKLAVKPICGPKFAGSA